MDFLVKVLAVAIIVYGCLLILRPGILKKIFEYVKQGNRLYIANGIKGVVGIFLIIASSRCSVPWIVLFLGALTVLSVIVGFLVKKKTVMELIERLVARPVKFVYLIGAIALALGVLLVLAA
ncbi:MAG: hypothetical protein U9R44_02260 [Candidatus Omnitrophota bacterium]|nr:hypothetical protein [Candidatus Omnitrophota bacterium]